MDPNEQNRFKKNSKYFTITVYAVVGFFICALLLKIIFDFSHVWEGFKVVAGVLSPFLIGTILAYLINPLFKFLYNTFFGKWLHMKKNSGLRKTLSLLISYIVIFGIIIVLICVIVPQFITSIKTLIGTIGHFSHTVQDWVDSLQSRFKDLNLEFLTDNINSVVPKLLEKLQESAEGLLSGVVSTSMGVISGVVKFILSIFVSIYILSDKDNLKKGLRKFFYSIFKKDTAANITRITRESSNIFSNYFTGKIFDSLIVGILCGIMMLILGLPYPLLVSVLVGVTNIIPFFGPFIGAIPSILIMLMIGWKEAIIFTILILVLQQLDGNVIGPKIIGDSTGLSPIWVLFAITIGGWIGGVGGMLFSVPIMAVIAHIAEEIVNNRLEKKGLNSMVEREEAPKTLRYSDLVRRIFRKKRKEKAEELEKLQNPEKKNAHNDNSDQDTTDHSDE